MPPEFSRFFKVDATEVDTNEGLTEVLKSDMRRIVDGITDPYHYEVVIGAGGLIMATPDLKYAMGIYTNDSTYISGEKISLRKSYTIWSWPNDTNKWVVGNKAVLPRGETRFRSYIIVGTLDEVRTAMRRLFIHGY